MSRTDPSVGSCLSSPSPPDCSAAPAGARDRDRSRRPARPGRAAATVLVVGLLLLGAAAAEAQTPVTLVSNQGQTADDSASTSGNDHAQLFHTGAHAAGYTFTGMHVSSEDAEGDDFDVEICEEDGSADEFPSSTCTALTAPASFAAGLLFFDHTGLALSANTNYVVVIKQRGTGSVELNSTPSGAEDTTGLADWSIKDTFYWNNSGTWTVKSGANEALRIIVYGYERVAVDTTPPALASATVEANGATIELTFDEVFDLGAASTLVFATAFSVTADGNAVTVGSMNFESEPNNTYKRIQLRGLSPAITHGQTVIVSYTDPTTGDDTSAVLEDAAGNDVASFTTGAGGVPAVINNLPPPPPTIDAIALTSDPGADNTYAISDTVTATVTFDAAVDITGTPQLELDFNGTAKAAACATGTNTTTMVCSYTVAVGDSAPNGVGIAANTLTGGTIYATGSTTTSADLTHSVVAIDTGHKVDGIRPTLVTTGSDAPTTSADGTQVILTFTEDIGGVSLSGIDLNVNSTSAYEQGATVSRSGRTVTLTLILTIQATWPVTVELSADAVDDDAGNGNLALAATTVTNAVGTTNAPPVFLSPTASRSVAENSAAGTNVGAALTATDTDNDPLTYTLEGTDATAFEIVSTSGRIRTTAGETYDREAQSSYVVTVKADDGNGGTDTIAVTITLTNVIEPPGRPAAPSVSSVAGSTTSLSVMWTAPANTGPAIDTYDLRYRQGTSGSWINGPQNVSGTNATISGLTANTLYQVQVQATSGEGDSLWSPPGSGQTNTAGNTAPTFSSQTASRRVAENSAAGTNVGAPVTATDADSGDTLTYTLDGTDAASFDIVSTSGRIRTTSGVTYDYETKSSYAVIVKADDGNGGSDTIMVTITVTDVDESPSPGPEPVPTPALPLLGHLLLALGLTAAGARVIRRRPRVPPAA